MDDKLVNRRAFDFFMGLGFAALGAYVAFEGLKAYSDPMMRTVERVVNPGSTTLVVGILLAVLGLGIAIFGFTGTGRRPFAAAAAAIPAALRSDGLRRGALVLAYIAVYFFVLWRSLPFWLSTMIYLAGTMRTFKAGAWWKILLISAITTALTWYVFARLAYVPLPTEGFWQAWAGKARG